MILELRALSVRQPWAWSIVHQGKDVENRKRTHPHRGRLLIHASAGMTHAEVEAWRAFLQERGLYDAAADRAYQDQDAAFERGGIIGVADVTGAVTESASPWWMGPAGLTLANARPLSFIPCKGTVAPLVWRPDDDVQERAALELGLLA